ncbi:MAG: OmpA family protein [Alphaproteobacteria bacterium]|nr:OmpA family protein [Alphaproteobacteria bacterium]
MQRILLTALTLAVLVYVLVLGVKWLSPRIEQDLAGRITTELAKDGQLWATPQVEGREVTLLGEAPTVEAKAAARAAVARVFGIAKVNDLITLPGQVVSNGLVISATEVATAPALTRAEKRALAAKEGAYTLKITKDGEALTLAGSVPDEAAKALLLTLAKTHLPEAKVDATSLTVVAEGAPAGWRSAAGTVLFNLVNLEQAEATLMGREVMVSGTVLSADFATNAESAIRTTMPTQYQVAFAVETSAPATVAATTDASATTTANAAVSATVATAPAASPTATTTTAAAVQMAQTVTDQALAAIEPSAGPALACASLAKLEGEAVRFAFNSAKVRNSEQPVLDRVASTIKGCQGANVLLKGYTDKTGSATYNQWLSQQRAEAALRALVRQGVAREALTAKGYGETNQFGSQAAVKTRTENRRVEFSPQGASPTTR